MGGMGWFWGRLGLVVLGCSAVTAGAGAQSPPLTPPPEPEHFEVALHARSQRASARAEQAAWLSVTVPLDKLALPRVVAKPTVAVPIALAPVPATPPHAPPTSSTQAPAASAPVASVPAPSAPAAPPLTFRQVRLLSEFSRRATVVALGVAGVAAERRRLDSLSSRARASALLPELRLRAVRNTDQALRWVPTADDPTRVTQADGAGLILEGSATFRLDRLLFAREELTVERVRLHAGEASSKLEARVQAALLGLFRARELACSSEVDEARTPQLLKVVELFAELNNLTAGWFSEQAPSFGREVWGFPEAVLGVCSAPLPPPAAAMTIPVASLENSE
jgi:hypothetical protein